jgi:hypothetical protein
VSAKGPIFSKSRGEGTVLLGGDAAEDAGHVYEGSETLIAIGTQAGKVLVFNILGLLVHDIAMDVSVIAVEWVGDMSAPSALPNPFRTVFQLTEEAQVPLGKDSGTVKKTVLSHKHPVKRKPVPSSVYSRSTTGTVKKAPRIPPGHILADPPASGKLSSSSLDSLYSPPTPRNFSVPYQEAQSTSTPTPPSKALLTPDIRADTPSSVYSRSISGIYKAIPKYDEETLSALSDTPLPPQHHLSIHALGIPLSTSSPSSLYSRFIDGVPIETTPLPQVVASRARQDDDGKSRVDCGFQARVSEKEEKGEAEIERLREEQKVLRNEVAALREELRCLRDVLLEPR